MDEEVHVPLRKFICEAVTVRVSWRETYILESCFVHSPTQLKNGSFLHWLEQPSPFMVFLSSHCSFWDLGTKREQELIQSSMHVIIITVLDGLLPDYNNETEDVSYKHTSGWSRLHSTVLQDGGIEEETVHCLPIWRSSELGRCISHHAPCP